MTIRKGETWGERAILPSGLASANSDAQAAELVRAGCREFLLLGGDMLRTLGGTPQEDLDGGRTTERLDQVRTLVPLDCLWVDWIDHGTERSRPVFAHAVVRVRHRPRRLHPGDISYVMNAQYRGSSDVAPRSHPNDGRFDVVTVAATMSWRQRWQMRQRFVTGTHLPHPAIRSASVDDSWSPGTTATLILDGVRVGKGDRIRVTIRPDSLRIWF